LTEELTQTEGKATMRRGHLGKPFGKDAPRTVRLITVELTHVKMQGDLHLLNREILYCAFIPAMDAASTPFTDWTSSRMRNSFTREKQTLALPLKREKPKATKVWKKRRERQGNTLSRCVEAKKIITLLFYHISTSF
jgi:hypothetical protein